MINFTATKDPDADLNYTIDWTAWLAGATIVSSTWTVSGSGATAHDASIDVTVKKTTVFVSGGTAGAVHNLTNRITTSGSPARTDDRTIVLTIASR